MHNANTNTNARANVSEVHMKNTNTRNIHVADAVEVIFQDGIVQCWVILYLPVLAYALVFALSLGHV